MLFLGGKILNTPIHYRHAMVSKKGVGKTILVVDDEEDNRTTLRMLLEKNGYKVLTAVDGDDCLKVLAKQRVDLVLLDIMMPGTPVRDIVRRIKDTRVAFLSVVRTSDAEKEELLCTKNVVDYIRKPFDVPLLLKKVEKLTG